MTNGAQLPERGAVMFRPIQKSHVCDLFLRVLFAVLVYCALAQPSTSLASSSPSSDGDEEIGQTWNSDPTRMTVPTQIAFQGFLTDDGGQPITTDSTGVGIVASLWDAETSGNQVWQETHPAIVITDGVFQLKLGEVQALDPEDFDGSPIFLGLAIDGDPEMSRAQLLSSAFAIRSEVADLAEGVAAGVAVTGVNGINDDVVLEGGQNVNITQEGSTLTIDATGSGGSDSDWTVDGNDMYSAVPGNVGIGESAPVTKLHVQTADLGISSAGLNEDLIVESTDAVMSLVSDGGGSFGSIIYLQEMDSGTPTDGWAIYRQTNGAGSRLKFAYGTSRLTIEPDGDVGIGVDPPLANLHVSGQTGSASLLLEADVDDSGEGDQPSIKLSQDGGLTIGDIGFFDTTNELQMRTTTVNGSSYLALAENNLKTGEDFIMGGGTTEWDGTSEGIAINARSTSWNIGVENEATVAASNFFIGRTSAPGANDFYIATDGKVGIGTSVPTHTLTVDGNSLFSGEATVFSPLPNYPKFRISGSSANALQLYNPITDHLTFYSGGIGSEVERFRLTPNGAIVNGTTTTSILHITGGSDLAEPFEVHGSTEVKPGMVLSIDPESPGELRISDLAYDRAVAGIASGANGVRAGITLRQNETVADGSIPVALSGRVYCLADASHGSIAPGDLLTSSTTPGHAMKVSDRERAHGAILGKAMSPLASGCGHVLVLVTLH